MEASSNNTMYVTYVEKHGAFVKVWGQVDKHYPISIENCLGELKPQFDEGHYALASPASIQIGLMCCAKYKDEMYYRARVTNVSSLYQNFVEVHFVDYGNKDIVPTSVLRSGAELSNILVTVPPQAHEFVLANVTHVGHAWEARTIALISDEIRYMNLQFIPVQQINPYLTLIKLFKNGEDYALSLFNRGYVLCMANVSQTMILQSINSTPPPTVNQTRVALPPPQIPPGIPTQMPQVAVPVAAPSQPTLPVQNTTTLLTFKGHTITPGTDHQVYVSYVSDGPCHFSVQLQRLEENLAKLMRELNRMELQPLEEHPLPGTVCLAKCVEDNNICRAVITSMSNNEAKVFYVDFGNTEVVANERLFQIPLKFVIMKVMSTRYALAGLENTTVTLEMKCAFKEFVSDKLLRMHSLPPPAKFGLPLCHLWDEKQNNALDVMRKVALLAYPESTTLTRGFCQEVIVSYVYSCSHFYVQLKSKEEDLRRLMEELQAIGPQAHPMKLSEAKTGLPCFALFDTDGQWYRGEIISLEGDIVKVRYVDYGNEELVNIINLRIPSGDMVTVLRPQALECCLNGYQNMSDDVERDTILEELILEKEFSMRVIEMHSNRALVDLIDSSRYNVGSLLLEKLALARSQVSPLLIQDSYQIEPRKRQSPNEKYERKNSRDTLNEETDRGISRKNLNNQFNKDFRNREFSRQDSNKMDSNDNQDKWNTESSAPEYNNNKKQDSWRQDRPPRRDNNERGGGWNNTKSEEWNGTTEDRSSQWGANKNQDSWRSRPRRDRDENSGSVPSEEWNGTKQERSPQWENKKQDSWRQDRPPRRRRDEGGEDGDASKNEWKSSGEDRGDWGAKKQDSWRQDRPPRRDRDESRDGGADKFRRHKQDGWNDGSTSWGQKAPNSKEGSEKGWEGKKREFSKPYRSDFGSEKSTKKVEDPAENTDLFTYPEVAGKTEEVLISWFHDPSNFYCQLKESQAEFRKLVEDIQSWYCKINNETLPVGAPAIAQFPEDRVLYRAYISEMKGSQYYVHFVDFGNFSTTDKVWPIEKKFMSLPAQGLYCSMNGLTPLDASGAWPPSESLTSHFDKESFMCTFVTSENNGHYVDLVNDGQSVNEALVRDGLAKYVEVFDPSILVGQQISVTVDDVQGLDTFNVSLPNGIQVLCTVHNLESASQTFEDTLKQYIGCIVIMYVDNVLEEKTEVTLYDASGVKIIIIEPDEGAYPSIEPLCPLPVLSSTVSGWVSFVDANEKKLFIQPTEHSDSVADLLDRLFNHYDTTTLEEPLAPEEGQHYAVHSSDANWYRALISKVDGDNVTVLYIDYGNSETVATTELRELADEFKQLHVLALEVTSPNIDDSFVEQEVSATVWYGESGWEAEIQLSGETVAAVEETTAAEQVQPVESTEGQLEQVAQPTEQAGAVGVPVCLSHTDSPSEFYLQLLEATETIDNLQATLQEEVEGYPDLENPGAGVLCAAQYSVDQQWYRAQILDADGEITSIRFVDYGNTDAITTNVKTLSPDMLALEQYARRCSLLAKPLEGEEWSSSACERFEALTQSEGLSVEIIHQDEKTTYVQLYADGQDVAKALLQEGLAAKLEFEIESSCTGYVSHLNSPSEFWIQLENSVADLEWIAEQLMTAASFAELEDLTPGSLCAALYTDDENWYRARILSNTIAGIEVLFVDYGNSCTCTGLRQLPEDLIMLSPLAQKCSLQKPPGILQWSSQATEDFKTISADGVTIFNIDKLSTGETLIVKLILNGQDVSEQLLPQTESAYITYINSIHDFWMQKVTDSSKSDAIAEHLANAAEFPACDTVAEGVVVAALQADDETWYRAQILNMKDTEYEVMFIDYGNTSSTSEIRALPDDMTDPPLAIKCKMEALPGFRWMDEEATEKLNEISNESSTVFETEFANDNIVRLYVNGCDIRSQMDTACISSVQSSPKKIAASKINVEDHIETTDSDVLNFEIENTQNSDKPDTDTETHQPLVRRSSTPHCERIVPGSICRGDLTEVDIEDSVKGAGSPESRSSTPECDKTVLNEAVDELNDTTLSNSEHFYSTIEDPDSTNVEVEVPVTAEPSDIVPQVSEVEGDGQIVEPEDTTIVCEQSKTEDVGEGKSAGQNGCRVEQSPKSSDESVDNLSINDSSNTLSANESIDKSTDKSDDSKDESSIDNLNINDSTTESIDKQDADASTDKSDDSKDKLDESSNVLDINESKVDTDKSADNEHNIVENTNDPLNTDESKDKLQSPDQVQTKVDSEESADKLDLHSKEKLVTDESGDKVKDTVADKAKDIEITS
ncbi:maternal protein tudor-like isoform X2 [Photinus pyralis]|uniref:maternal protein tudor-like isoform X2 n=1 Tax=Photinus pyralis TaxID=7054 RepID=UPI001267509C|nr:maternal protein tudor-like isoform X2 [Photinus pyralis]